MITLAHNAHFLNARNDLLTARPDSHISRRKKGGEGRDSESGRGEKKGRDRVNGEEVRVAEGDEDEEEGDGIG